MPHFVKITLLAPPYSTSVKGTDERLCCIQSENVYRAWIRQGFQVHARIECADAERAERIRFYLRDVLQEITHDLLLDPDAELSLAEFAGRMTSGPST